ncbi:hypothetical protein AYI68_g2883 [Smittium mucronatum]|uniref:Transporter n=1 Tax=Smittium mucronatum TaxID=133383 RepID=A0A1R0H1H4_9FUNG|nr:hypothetical protein AYI68_g2883 [Smittium mucronatum]
MEISEQETQESIEKKIESDDDELIDLGMYEEFDLSETEIEVRVRYKKKIDNRLIVTVFIMIMFNNVFQWVASLQFNDSRNIAIPVMVLANLAMATMYTGIYSYLIYWYSRDVISTRVVIISLFSEMSGTITDYAFNKAVVGPTKGYGGRTSICIVIAVIGVLLALAVYFVLSETPKTCKFLLDDEKSLAVRIIGASNGEDFSHRMVYSQLFSAFTDPKVYIFGIIGFCIKSSRLNTQAIATGYTLHYSNPLDYAASPGLILPSAVGIIALTLTLSYIENVSLSNILIGASLINGLCSGFLLIFVSHSQSLILLAFSSFAERGSFPVAVAWMLVNGGGSSKRIASIGIFFFISEMSSVVFPYITNSEDTYFSKKNNIYALALSLLSVILVFGINLHFKKLNIKRSQNITPMGHLDHSKQVDLNDKHPNFIYAN